jgi:exodeoxyribonuclease VII large subunit
VRLVIYPSLVQGAEAPAALVAALQRAGERREVEALLLVRGGGSLEDLWAFNDERVVQAMAACPLPVLSGVGHETDVTLADLVADLRAPTPTAAAEMAAPARDDAAAALQQQAQRLQRGLERSLQQQAQRLDTLALRLGQPARRLQGQAQRLEALADRLGRAVALRQQRLAEAPARLQERLCRAVQLRLQGERVRLQSAAQALQAHDPHRVLQRGYAWVEAADGRPVLGVRGLQPGQPVRAVWADGQALAEVREVLPRPVDERAAPPEALPPAG